MTSVDGIYIANERVRNCALTQTHERSASVGVCITDHAQFDAQIAQFDDVCQEQTAAFCTARWPSLPLEPLLFTHNDEVVGGALILMQRLPLGLGSIAICKWGPMLRDSRRADAADLYRGMAEAIVADYGQSRGMTVSILPRVTADAVNVHQSILQRRGFVEGRNVPYPSRYVVDLAGSDDIHRVNLNSKWRYHLGKAEKAGLVFEEAGAERLGDFDKLYEAMSARKKFPDYSAYHTVPSLFAANEALRPALFFVRHNGEIVAGAIIFRSGDNAVYLYGATTDAALPLRAGYLMHWEIIRWLKRNTKARYYDLGGNDGFMGLHQFKKQMVGTAGWIHRLPPIQHYAEDRTTLAIGCGAFALREAVLELRQRLLRPFNNDARPDMEPEPRP